VEEFQPSLLKEFPGNGERAYRSYRRWSVGLLTIMLTLCASLPPGIALGLEWSAFHDATTGMIQGFASFATLALITLCGGALGFASTRWMRFGLFIGISFGIVRGGVVFLSPAEGLGGTPARALEAAAITIPLAVFIFCLFGYQTIGKIENYKRRYRDRPGIDEFYEVLPIEPINWVWFDRQNPWRGAWIGLVVGPIFGALFWAGFGPARGIGFGIIITLFVTTFSGQLGTGVRVTSEPNEGIRRSLKHGGLMMSLFTMTSVVGFGLSYGLTYGWLQGLINGLLGLGAAFTFLAFGGIPVVRHVCVGRALHGLGVLPPWSGWPPWRKTITFLDDMVRFKLLRSSGSGYAFRHDFLRQFYRRVAERTARARV
jgi:hypothetical protein